MILPQKQAGFTLIEMLVVVFIIATISALVLVNYQAAQNRYYVSGATQKLAADLRRVQNMAVAGKLQNGAATAGYGLYVSGANSYLLFYNPKGVSRKYYSAISSWGSRKSEVLESVVLDKVTLTLSPAGSYRVVYFVPPDPITYINNFPADSLDFIVSLGDYSKTVRVFASGRIEID